jgi:uncharacterized membrane protein required for colicin V production
MIWVDIIIVLIFVFGFLGGLKAGAVNGFFSLLTLIIAIPVTGAFYGYIASLLSFLPGENWENFSGFLITLVIISIILSLIFLIPRHLIKAVFNGGGFFSIIGGVFNLANSAIGLALLVLLLQTYPVIPWLNNVIANSTILAWLGVNLDFIRYFLPAVFKSAVPTY